MLTGDQYQASLRDGRKVFFMGEPVDDVTAEPAFRAGVEWTARGYDEHYDGDASSRGPYFMVPRSTDDLREMEHRIRRWDMATIATSQGLLMAITAASRMKADYPHYAERALAFFDESSARDIRCAMTITDAKGDRRLSPGKQIDPDHYVRVVDRQADGVVIRGAKMHITSAVNGHELMIMPTKRMKAGEEQWAFAGAVPVNAEGVRLIATSTSPGRSTTGSYPYSSRHAVPEAMVVFDDVFVPNDRVFLCGEVEHSATWAHALGMWERLGNLSHLVEVADGLVGLAHLIAEANGLSRVPHIHEKIGNMTVYATLLAATLEGAINNVDVSAEGYVTPSEQFTNAGKFYAAENFHAVIRDLHDIAGGSVVTAPSLADLANDEIGPHIEKYMRTKDGVDGEYRMRLFHAIRDFTADAYAGWLGFTILLGGGGLHAAASRHDEALRRRPREADRPGHRGVVRMMTGEEYRASVLDGRAVFVDGARVADVTADPGFQPAVQWLSSVYDRFHDPDPDAAGPYYAIPRSAADLPRDGGGAADVGHLDDHHVGSAADDAHRGRPRGGRPSPVRAAGGGLLRRRPLSRHPAGIRDHRRQGRQVAVAERPGRP